jgi:hypothetical protein
MSGAAASSPSYSALCLTGSSDAWDVVAHGLSTMGSSGVAVGAGGVLICLVVWVVIDTIGQGVADVTLDATKEAVFRRPGFAVRRQRYRPLLHVGSFVGALAGLAGIIWLAAATSGDPADTPVARFCAILTCLLAVIGVTLLVVWWRLAGRPKYS